MPKEQDLVLALDMLTEGPEAETVFTERLESPKTSQAQKVLLAEARPLWATKAMQSEAVETRKQNKSWTKAAGVQGLGVGAKITDGEQLPDLVLKVYVAEKKPESKLKGTTKVPRSVQVEGVGTLPTDVEAIGKMKLEANTTRVRPAIPGFSIGHVKITAGTLGCLVHKTGNKTQLYVLSNSHVLANEGIAAKGDKQIQPGDIDGGSLPADLIGTLADWAPFTFTPSSYPNLVDAAIAEVKTADVTSSVRLIGVPAGVSTKLRRDMHVKKTGRTTDHTIGIIKDINYRTALTYAKPGGGSGRVGFKDQVLCTRYTAGGDSGSAIFNNKNEVVGLHFAGSPSTSIFNKIQHVLAAFGIAVVTWKV